MPNLLARSRFAAFVRQDGLCHYCEKPIWLGDSVLFRARYSLTESQTRLRRCTAEHLIARKDGGGDGPDNIVAACPLCNWRRHRCANELDPVRYQIRVRARIRSGRWLPMEVLAAFTKAKASAALQT
jgi:hypothetical protein